MNAQLIAKYKKLKEVTRSLERVVVALSGGIDSSLVAYVAAKELGENALAVTSGSESLKQADLVLAQEITSEWGLAHEVIHTREIDNANYVSNPNNRCYYCKSTLYSDLDQIAKEGGYSWVLNGTNSDDLGDYRPGLIAAEEHKVKSPLLMCDFNKQDIRDLAAHLKLRNANKPAAACLSSRVPYGTAITKPLLKKIEDAERILAATGLSQFRVRHHGDVARLEVMVDEFELVMANRSSLEQQIKALGYGYVALDLKGFRSGSMNEPLGARSNKLSEIRIEQTRN